MDTDFYCFIILFTLKAVSRIVLEQLLAALVNVAAGRIARMAGAGRLAVGHFRLKPKTRKSDR
jgi:hypothetical protein